MDPFEASIGFFAIFMVFAPALVITAAIAYWLVQRGRTSGKKAQQEMLDRIETLERRITDIQDVVLSLDDRLDHATPSGPRQDATND